MNFDEFQPSIDPMLTVLSEEAEPVFVPPHDDLPKTLEDYPYESSNAYDLSIEAAAKAGLPVFDVSGGYSRRVITLERVKYIKRKTRHPMGGEIESRYGYAIRLCITVNKFNAEASLKLPVLAASAQLGHIEAKWGLSISGLAGKQVSKAILPPESLDVETFVLASQSLGNAIEAVHHETTKFTPVLLSQRLPRQAFEYAVAESIGRLIALDTIKDGRSFAKLQDLVDSYPEDVSTLARETYRQFVGDLNIGDKPSTAHRQRARSLLRNIDLRNIGNYG